MPRRLDGLAEYYDLRHGAFSEDVPFYQRLAEEAEGPILELGCGTGRLLAALCARHPVIGVDVSGEMLRRARAAVTHHGCRNVLLLRADLRRPVVQRGAGLAILALNTLCHFASQAEQLAVLRAARESLAPEGLLALDVPNPHLELEARPAGACLLEAIHECPDKTIYEWSVTDAELGEQLLRVRSIYDRVAPDGSVSRRSLAFGLRLFYRYELELLLVSAGLRPEAVLGDYDHSPYRGDSPRLLVLARR